MSCQITGATFEASILDKTVQLGLILIVTIAMLGLEVLHPAEPNQPLGDVVFNITYLASCSLLTGSIAGVLLFGAFNILPSLPRIAIHTDTATGIGLKLGVSYCIFSCLTLYTIGFIAGNTVAGFYGAFINCTIAIDP